MDIAIELISAIVGLMTATLSMVVKINYKIGRLEAKITMLCERVSRLEENSKCRLTKGL